MVLSWEELDVLCGNILPEQPAWDLIIRTLVDIQDLLALFLTFKGVVELAHVQFDQTSCLHGLSL